jgi:O-antigen ligase
LNLSLRGSNPNQLTYVGGLEVWRAGGFFQDPQRAGAYLAAIGSFLLVLAVRKRFPSGPLRRLVWVTIVLGAAGLLMTISRGAIASFVGVSSVVLVAFNRWTPATKVAIVTCVALAGLAIALSPARSWDSALPAALTGRFEHTAEELDIRRTIWLDTVDMFTDHPLVGVGPGAFRSYLLATRPGQTMYYGIGAGTDPQYVPDQPESGYLKVLYEGGVAGALALLLLVGDILRRAIRTLATPQLSPLVRSELLAGLSGLATLAATFVTLFTVSDPRVAAVFALLCAIVLERSSQPSASVRRLDAS